VKIVPLRLLPHNICRVLPNCVLDQRIYPETIIHSGPPRGAGLHTPTTTPTLSPTGRPAKELRRT
jgi:hypothetical protein